MPGFVSESGTINDVGIEQHSHDSVDASETTELGNVDLGQANWLRGGCETYNVGTGFWMGYDNGAYKLFFGNSSGNKVTWDGSTLSITGTLIAGEIHIPDQDTTANSFHVASDADTWWGATETNFNADNDNATAYVLKTGAAKFQSVILDTDVVINDVQAGSEVVPSPGYENLAAFWSFDEGQGTKAIDDTTNANDGTISTATYTSGISGTALEFDGASGDVLVSDNAAIQNIWDSGGSTSFWFNPDSDGEGNDGHIFDKNLPGSDGWVLATANDNASAIDLIFVQSFSGTAGRWDTTTRPLSLNAWSHVVITYDSDSVSNDPTIYVNGTKVTISEVTTPVGTRSSDVGNDLYIGNRSGDDKTIDGTLDEVRFYNDILADNEVIALRESPSGNVAQGVKALGGTYASAGSGARVQIFPDATSGFKVLDSSGNTVFDTVVSGADVGDVIMGDESTETYAKWNDSAGEFEVSGQITFGRALTAGFALTSGEAVTIESDGKIYPTRVSDFDESESAASMLSSTRGSAASNLVWLTKTLAFFTYGSSGSGQVGRRITYDIPTESVTSVVSGTNITSAGDSFPKLTALTATTALLVDSDNTNTVYAQVLSGLDSGITSNTQQTVDSSVYQVAAAVDNPFNLAPVDSTHSLVAYIEDSSQDLKLRVITISSSTTVSVGSEQSVLTGTYDSINDFVRFGDTEYYGIAIQDTANNDQRIVIIQWDGASLTVGSEAAFDVSDVQGDVSLIPMNDTTLGFAYQKTTSLDAGVVTRSGTVPTVQSATTGIDTTTVSSTDVEVFEIGEDTFGVLYLDATTTDLKGVLIRVTGTTAAKLGTETAIAGIAAFGAKNDVGALKASPKHFLLQYDDGAEDIAELWSLENNFDQFIGISTGTIAASSSGRIALDGYSDDLSGLTVADIQYIDCDGALTTAANNGIDRVGIALSSTELKIDQQ